MPSSDAPILKPWQILAEQKRNALLASIPAEWRLPTSALASLPPTLTGAFIQQFLSPDEVEITESPTAAILARTASGAWPAVLVATAFAHRAAVAHQLTGCLSEFFPEAALASARALDAHLAEHGAPLGPLHGLPVSLKDSVDVRGQRTTLGLAGWIPRPPRDDDAAAAAALRRAGAVLFAKTAVPQASFAAETFGALVAAAAAGVPNPLRTSLSAGGSSGGEAALLALRGSPLGLGTDIGGSIRWPAASVGGYGLRPSAGRLPYAGVASVVGGLESVTDVRFAVGPMTVGDVGGLGLAMRALLADRPWERDPLVVEMPWREALYARAKRSVEAGGRLALGVARWDGVVVPQPPVARAIRTVEEILKRAGHEVIDFEPPGPEEAEPLWSAASYADLSHAHAQFALSGEPVDPRMPPAFDASSRGAAGRSAGLPTAEVQRLNVRIREWRAAYLRYWMATAARTAGGRPVDAVVMPVAPVSAAPLGRFRWAGYAAPAVLNDHPAAVLPVARADRDVDVAAGQPPAQDGGPWARVNRAIHDDYDPELYHGMPVNVQVVGRRFHEEQVLAITEYLDKLVRGAEVATSHKL